MHSISEIVLLVVIKLMASQLFDFVVLKLFCGVYFFFVQFSTLMACHNDSAILKLIYN